MPCQSKCEYMPLATNNFATLANGCACVCCFNIFGREEITEITDVSTAICPYCYVDAVIPLTPSNFQNLTKWRLQGFGKKTPDHYSEETKQKIRTYISTHFNKH